jgi:hypothetical protein
MTTVKRQMLAVLAAAAFASAAHATIDFDVAGLAGTGVTAHVTFTYTSSSSTGGVLKFVIENTTDYSNSGLTDSRITAFSFNLPSIGGTTFTSIAGVTDGASPIALGPPPSQVIPENQPSTFNEAGWYGLFESNAIKTPNAAGDFDFGIMNAGNANAFITDGVGSGPRILNDSDSNDSTTYLLNLLGTGLDTGDSTIEQAIMSALSVPQNGGLAYTFGVRFQGIPSGGGSDLATPTPPVIPAPGAAALAAFGLGIVGWVNRRQTR